MTSAPKKTSINVFNVVMVGVFSTLTILLFLFVGYTYALQYNEQLYIPGFSEPANKLIGVFWKEPYEYPTPTAQEASVLYGQPRMAPEFVGITRWYNNPTSIAQLKGRKIIVLTFGRLYCTYCQNVYTYLTEWQRTYGEYIQVVGIQSPKYDGEKVWEDVEKEIRERDVNFPVGFDENRLTKEVYAIELVPIVMVIDLKGNIVYTHLGEGGFAEAEKAIQEVIRLDHPGYK